MIKKILSLLLALCLLLGGCSLAREDDIPISDASQDRLIGAYITREGLDLFDIEAYLNDHLSEVLKGGEIQGDTSAYEGRIYAERTGEGWEAEYTFPDLGGYAMFCPTFQSEDLKENYTSSFVDSGISDLKMGRVYVDDSLQEMDLEGTVYLADDLGHVIYYLNPVFQDDQGRVYLLAGNSMGFDLMGTATLNSSNEVTTTVNGVETTIRGSVRVTFQGVPRPEKIVILQMDGNNDILSREEYAPGTVPEEITPLEDTAYFLVETHTQSDVRRELFGRDVETLTTYEAMEDGVCRSISTQLLWQEEE